MEPEIIIFDETTSCLDPKQAFQIMELFDEKNRNGKTVILSTHDVETAYSWTDYIIVLKDNEILKVGEPLSIFADSNLLKESNLEKPIILEIFEQVKETGNLPQLAKIPKNKEELFKLIKMNKLNIKKVVQKK